MGQDVNLPQAIKIDDYELDIVHKFTYLGFNISDDLSLDAEIKRHIGKAALTLTCLATSVWENNKPTVWTKIAVCDACIISTLLYGSETWTTYGRQEMKLNNFHLCCHRNIPKISLKDKVANTEVLSCTDIPTMYILLR